MTDPAGDGRPSRTADAAAAAGARPAAADAVVVAAGESRRMGGIDKLLEPIAGRPLLAWTLDALASSPLVGRIVVVVAPERLPELAAARWLPRPAPAFVPGGARRQASVAAGVAALAQLDGPPDRVVLVHDGARPVVRSALIERVVAAAERHGAAIPVVPVVETVKRLDGETVAATVDRDGLVLAQTPQAARLGLLVDAFRRHPQDGDATWTDEAALLAACSISVHATPGDPDNIKVTLPADLPRVARSLAGTPRVGFGHDGHRFGAGEPLALGGIELPGAPALHGHSDGDVALHAVADALLGAGGLGDLGRLFPADDRTPRGIPSARLVAEVVGRLADAGLRPASVDVTIVGARPRLGGRLDEMRAAIAGLVGVEPEAVSVKASTGNLEGMEGAGRGISARVVAVVRAEP